MFKKNSSDNNQNDKTHKFSFKKLLLIFSFSLIVLSCASIIYYVLFVDHFDNVILVDTKTLDPKNEGKIIYVNGKINETQLIDNSFSLTINALALKRYVEIYQWTEDGTNKVWLDKIVAVKDPSKQNPTVAFLKSKEWKNNQLAIGDLSIERSLAQNYRPEYIKLPLTEVNYDKLSLSGKQAFFLYNGYYYYGLDPNAPNIGDMKISYYYVPVPEVSIIGQQKDKMIIDAKIDNHQIGNMAIGKKSIEELLPNKLPKTILGLDQILFLILSFGGLIIGVVITLITVKKNKVKAGYISEKDKKNYQEKNHEDEHAFEDDEVSKKLNRLQEKTTISLDEQEKSNKFTVKPAKLASALSQRDIITAVKDNDVADNITRTSSNVLQNVQNIAGTASVANIVMGNNISKAEEFRGNIDRIDDTQDEQTDTNLDDDILLDNIEFLSEDTIASEENEITQKRKETATAVVAASSPIVAAGITPVIEKEFPQDIVAEDEFFLDDDEELPSNVEFLSFEDIQNDEKISEDTHHEQGVNISTEEVVSHSDDLAYIEDIESDHGIEFEEVDFEEGVNHELTHGQETPEKIDNEEADDDSDNIIDATDLLDPEDMAEDQNEVDKNAEPEEHVAPPAEDLAEIEGDNNEDQTREDNFELASFNEEEPLADDEASDPNISEEKPYSLEEDDDFEFIIEDEQGKSDYHEEEIDGDNKEEKIDDELEKSEQHISGDEDENNEVNEEEELAQDIEEDEDTASLDLDDLSYLDELSDNSPSINEQISTFGSDASEQEDSKTEDLFKEEDAETSEENLDEDNEEEDIFQLDKDDKNQEKNIIDDDKGNSLQLDDDNNLKPPVNFETSLEEQILHNDKSAGSEDNKEKEIAFDLSDQEDNEGDVMELDFEDHEFDPYVIDDEQKPK